MAAPVHLPRIRSSGPTATRASRTGLVAAQPGITLAQAAVQFGLKDATGLYAVARRLQNDVLVHKTGVELRPTAEARTEVTPAR